MINKEIKFDNSELSNFDSDVLYWKIKDIDNQINTFAKQKEKERVIYQKAFDTKQIECSKSKEGHDFRLYKKAALEIDHDTLKCQKCGFETT